MSDIPAQSRPHQLHRSLGLAQATALNMLNMIGPGPFFAIPLILATMGGPQAMLGWILGAVLALCDGMVWAELASAFPSSGGTLEYFEAGLRRHPTGTAVALPVHLAVHPLRTIGGRLRDDRFLPVPELPAADVAVATEVAGGRRGRPGRGAACTARSKPWDA